jgi:histone-lysine N-methyltransferase SETMAR
MTKPKALINAPKIMVLVIWGVDWAAPVEIVPAYLRARAKYMCDSVLLHLEVSVRACRANQGLRVITLQWDNAPSHTAKAAIAKVRDLEMKQMPDPPHSPDITPSDYFFFIHLKHKLQGCSYDSTNELFSAIRNLMENLEISLLHRVFDTWISCLHLPVESGGDYLQIWQKNFATHPVA